MKKGEIYICEDCGLELEVVNECRDVGTPAESCGCHTESETGDLLCCNKQLIKKES